MYCFYNNDHSQTFPINISVFDIVEADYIIIIVMKCYHRSFFASRKALQHHDISYYWNRPMYHCARLTSYSKRFSKLTFLSCRLNLDIPLIYAYHTCTRNERGKPFTADGSCLFLFLLELSKGTAQVNGTKN